MKGKREGEFVSPGEFNLQEADIFGQNMGNFPPDHEHSTLLGRFSADETRTIFRDAGVIKRLEEQS